MDHHIVYKIQNAYLLPYSYVIDSKVMGYCDKTNETIASSRIYLICKVKRKFRFFRWVTSKPQVLYVGETFQKGKRFSNHEKLLKATTLVGRNETLLVYFLHLRFSFLGIPPYLANPHDLLLDISDIKSKSSIQLIERLLIKLFNPLLNELHNNQTILEDNLVKEKLINNNIRYVTLDIGMEDDLFSFSGGKRSENIDWYQFDLKTNDFIRSS